MKPDSSQAETHRSPREEAKHLLLKEIGARRVAAWCGVAELTVYQWLQRGTDTAPIPSRHVPAILAGARSDGVEIEIATLWPAMGGASTSVAT